MSVDTSPPEPDTVAESTRTRPRESSLPAPGEPGYDDLDKVRRILFGQQIQEYEERIARLEEYVTRGLNALKDTMDRRFEALEQLVKEESDALSSRLNAEQQQRAATVEKVAKEVRTLSHALETSQSQFQDQFDEVASIKERMLNQSDTLVEEMQHQYESILETVREKMEAMQTQSTGRAELADLFAEISRRLKND